MSDWDEIRRAYVERGVSCKALAQDFGIPYGSLLKTAKSEDWRAQRRAFRAGGARMERVTGMLLDRIEQTLNGDGALEPKELKAVTGALRELRALQTAAAEEPAADGPLTVRFVGEAGEMSR